MRLLFDQNLSDRLLRILADEYPESIHVRHVGPGIEAFGRDKDASFLIIS